MVLFSNDLGALQVHFIKDSSVSHLAADFRVLLGVKVFLINFNCQ